MSTVLSNIFLKSKNIYFFFSIEQVGNNLSTKDQAAENALNR
jgi:hypothetical protein